MRIRPSVLDVALVVAVSYGAEVPFVSVRLQTMIGAVNCDVEETFTGLGPKNLAFIGRVMGQVDDWLEGRADSLPVGSLMLEGPVVGPEDED